jgi:hypothetical protein
VSKRQEEKNAERRDQAQENRKVGRGQSRCRLALRDTGASHASFLLGIDSANE